MVSACVEITTTRDIARQILRHRSFSFQEFSQRYADPVQELDFVLRDARLQDTRNRQNSIETTDAKVIIGWIAQQQKVIDAAKEAYSWAISNGIAKEQARAVLPEGNTVSRLYMNGTLRSWIHYIQLRSANGTQKEHIEIAKACASVIAEIFPLTAELVSE
jgi:thymidylate synthase (FAD)